jgi:ABC-2 type transport system permease protein
VRAVRGYAAGAAAILKRDFVIFASYRLRFLSELVAAAFGTTLFYYVSRLVTGGTFDSSDAYFAYAVIGFAVLQVLTAGLTLVPFAIRQELVAGTFERLLVSPVGAIHGVLAMSVFPFLAAVVSALLTIIFAAVVFGMPVEWSTAPLALPASVLGAVAFLPFALALAALVFVVKQAGAGAGFVVSLLSLVGGVFFPVALLPDWIQWASEVQPLTPAADLLRHLVAGAPIESAWGAAGRLALFAVVLLPISILLLRRCLRFGQRRGTVLEY